MIQRLLPAQRRFFFECAGIAVLTLLWLVCLVWAWAASRRPRPSPTSG